MKPLIWKMPSGRYLLIENYAFNGTSTTDITLRGETKDITEEVQRIDAEARADEARKCAADVCGECGDRTWWTPAERENDRRWIHRWKGKGTPAENHCLATRIHERRFLENLRSLKGGEGKEP